MISPLKTALLCAVLSMSPLSAWAEDAPAQAAHLASYKSKTMAERGWRVLTEAYSSVLYFQPAIREVDLPGKGHYFRLYAEGTPDMLASLCPSMKARKLYCVMHPVAR